MSAPIYDSYKKSGVEWLGKVPSHWRIAPFWSLYRRTKRTGFPDADLLSVYRDYGVIRKSDRDDNFNNPSDDLSTYQLVEPGDLAMNKMKAWQGSLGVSAHRGIVSPAYFVFQAHHAENRQFLHYLLRSRGYAVGFMSISKGIRIGQWDIDPDHLRRVPVPLPSLSEQAAIAAFLDRETGKIDALVEAQTRLIELLKEKRQAVISHAVTKGLDPAAPMKDSGVEWLGQVPAHWEVVKVVRHFRAAKGREAALLTKEYCSENAGTFPVYSGQTENNGIMGYLDRFEFDAGLEGYLLATTVGAKAMTVSHISGKFSLSQNCMIIRPTNEAVLPRFYYYHFQPTFSFHRALIPDHMQASFRMEDLYGFFVALPPLEEQYEISAHLDDTLTQFRNLEAQAVAAIALLQERRAALISAAVTGKIDVRGLAREQAKAA